MSNDSAGMHNVRAATSSGRPEAEANGEHVEPSDIVDAEVIDPDVVVVDEVTPTPASGARDRDPAGTSPSAAYSGVPADAEERASDAISYPADDQTTYPAGGPAEDPGGERTADAARDLRADPDGERTEYPRHDLRAGGAGDRPAAADRDLPADAGLAGAADLMHERWAAIQSTFVDDPHGSVAAAADLVAEAIGTLVAGAQERERGLRGEWDRDGVDTEGLRTALRDYRGFLDRLVSV